MSDEFARDQEARRVSVENEKRYQAEIREVARRNEEVQRQARKVRAESERIKVEIRRQADLY